MREINKVKPEQLDFFNDIPNLKRDITDPYEEWKEMPEFVQEEELYYKQIIIRFKTEKDYDNFGKLINQNLTLQTKSIWYPKYINDLCLICIDESQESEFNCEH